jgi:hypothetical protein
MIQVGSKVRWKKWRGRQLNKTAFLAMGDCVMTVLRKHPMFPWWECVNQEGHTDWVPSSEIWELKIRAMANEKGDDNGKEGH